MAATFQTTANTRQTTSPLVMGFPRSLLESRDTDELYRAERWNLPDIHVQSGAFEPAKNTCLHKFDGTHTCPLQAGQTGAPVLPVE
ncbi:MAG: hypothetical protein HRF42_01175 [Candidatus Brocadia sp.]